MTIEYQPAKVEQQAQTWWKTNKRFEINEDPAKEKYYVLAMFPYPSGRLHVGHARVYTITDLLARFYRMQGKQVLHPMGWDAFGLPAENAAVDLGSHPSAWTYSNIDHMRKQLQRLGYSYDWRREFATCDSAYYKWEQWLFTEMFKHNLAYRKELWVNWDPVDQTVLANEQVENGLGWRSGAMVERKKLSQWNIRVTAYAEELLADLQKLDWPAKIISMQTNWLGKSVGVQIDFPLVGRGESLRVFTTRPDTIMGATFMAIAADHPLIDELAANNPQLEAFAVKCRVPREHDQELIKEGMPIGLEVTHPLSGEKLPVWVANFVLMEYGTGAIMSVPAHDQRDWEFAKECNLPIKQVIKPADESNLEMANIGKQAYTQQGLCINSGKYDGLDFAKASEAIIKDLADKSLGQRQTTWRLRDWGVSRQRYWGAPIPIVHCDDCGEVPVPLEQLPVELPADLVLDGRGSPLAKDQRFVNTSCPTCGKDAKRDTDTLDTFFESSWYQSRFASYNCDSAMLDSRASYWCPVDQYVGGIEHAILHLLYARFFHKVMRDLLPDSSGEPIITSDEPFTSLLAQGMVLAPTYQRKDGARTVYANELDLKLAKDDAGRFGIDRQTGQRFEYAGVNKMSKSKGNGVDPERIVDQYGADTIRLYLLFAAPPEHSLEWSESGVIGMQRYLNRLWSLAHLYAGLPSCELSVAVLPQQRELWRKAHQVIAKVGDDIARRKAFNTAVAAIMELTNALGKFVREVPSTDRQSSDYALAHKVIEYLLLMLAPSTPHICHSLWQTLGHQDDLLDHPFPQADRLAGKEDSITLVIQVNGKVRAKMEMPIESSKQQLEQAALAHPNIINSIANKKLIKVIVVPSKLVNLVVK